MNISIFFWGQRIVCLLMFLTLFATDSYAARWECEQKTANGDCIGLSTYIFDSGNRKTGMLEYNSAKDKIIWKGVVTFFFTNGVREECSNTEYGFCNGEVTRTYPDGDKIFGEQKSDRWVGTPTLVTPDGKRFSCASFSGSTGCADKWVPLSSNEVPTREQSAATIRAPIAAAAISSNANEEVRPSSATIPTHGSSNGEDPSWMTSLLATEAMSVVRRHFVIRDKALESFYFKNNKMTYSKPGDEDCYSVDLNQERPVNPINGADEWGWMTVCEQLFEAKPILSLDRKSVFSINIAGSKRVTKIDDFRDADFPAEFIENVRQEFVGAVVMERMKSLSINNSVSRPIFSFYNTDNPWFIIKIECERQQKCITKKFSAYGRKFKTDEKNIALQKKEESSEGYLDSATIAIDAKIDDGAKQRLVDALQFLSDNTGVNQIAATKADLAKPNTPNGGLGQPRFKSVDGNVLDTRTGLVWAAADNGSDISWDDAGRYCSQLTPATWSLPTREELMAISGRTWIDEVKVSSSASGSGLFRLTGANYWSSERSDKFPSEAWLVETTFRREATLNIYQNRSLHGARTRALCVKRGN